MPTGETIVSHSYGAAIYGNKDNVDQDGNPLGTYNYSAGGNNKNQDHDETNYVTPDFQKSGHKDFFLVRNKDGANSTIAVVLGKMLGGGSAGWHGTCDGKPVTIDPNGGAEAKYMFGLEAQPTNDAINKAKAEATTIISGNYSYTHGGGIMTNGDVVAGSTQEVKVYPKMKLNGSKVLEDGTLKGDDFDFQLLRQNKIINEQGGISYTVPSFDSNGKLQLNGCSVVDTVKNDGAGNLTFDLGEVYADDGLVYYLVEVPGTDKDKGVDYDKTIYKN